MPGEDKSEGTGMKTIGLLAIGLIAGIIIGVLVGAFAIPQTQSLGVANTITSEAAGEKAVDFLSDYGGLPPGGNVTLINVTEQGDANLYKIAVNLSAQGMSKTLESYMTKDGKMLLQGVVIDEFKEEVEQQEQQRKEAENRSRVPQQEQQKQTTIGNFIVSEDEICLEEDKPIIYYFGSDGCGYCKWEHPIIVNVTSNFEGYISLHDNMNSDADSEIFSKYSTGGVPTLVFGCKYYRVGAGTGMGEEQESKALTALICDLTGNKPVEVCLDPEIVALVAQLG